MLRLHSLERLKEGRNLFGLLLNLAFTVTAAAAAATAERLSLHRKRVEEEGLMC